MAPENVETLGERKLTIIAQGATLKALMVQIPKALQDCHWDVVTTGEKLTYLLHRENAADERIARLLDQDPKQAEHRAAAVARVDLARQALAMSAEELEELEKTDPYLARSVQDPKSKFMLELFLALPEEQMNQFLDTGDASMSYSSAPERFRVSSQKIVQDALEDMKDNPAAMEISGPAAKHLDQATIGYKDVFGDGASSLSIEVNQPGAAFETVELGYFPALWSQYPTFFDRQQRQLFLGTGAPDDQTATQLIQEWKKKGEAAKQKALQAAGQEPRNPRSRRW